MRHYFRLTSWCGLAWAGLYGCGEDEAFLSLASLCTERASDVCAAQNGGCCAPSDPATCEAAGVARCMAEQDLVTAESGRRYDSVAAARQAQLARSLMSQCMPAPALSSYFQGGLAPGSACERAAQCESGACSGQPLGCVEPAAPALCAQ
ncbi:MAG: hypothetical protein JWN48_4575 [Myxococcaceae bacterium]|nr:hypothetical protein [Myxococcaceae bacterium]